MKEKVKCYIAGLLSGLICISAPVLAKTATEYIEVHYDNIKVYKDNVLCELKDANGSTIEPFIYNGTTYMPVRGTASLADMEVTWEGQTKSVYLWDEILPDGTYLMDFCPPYETDDCKLFLQEKGQSFQMAGTKYTNGFTLYGRDSYAMFNLNSQYSHINFTIGHVDDTTMSDVTVSFFLDGKLAEEITVGASDMPKTISLPVRYALQLKIMTSDGKAYTSVGLGNITISS